MEREQHWMAAPHKCTTYIHTPNETTNTDSQLRLPIRLPNAGRVAHGGAASAEVGSGEGRDVVDHLVRVGVGVPSEGDAHTVRVPIDAAVPTAEPLRVHTRVPDVAGGVDSETTAQTCKDPAQQRSS